ncbi:MAG: GHKL domain-containing protein [Bdellovibrionaceae bacterium]|jgi:signal transduction histidine kinase|nr:GHKL domain-containing protein [Pseudobdellovibrionaceae bacterium]
MDAELYETELDVQRVDYLLSASNVMSVAYIITAVVTYLLFKPGEMDGFGHSVFYTLIFISFNRLVYTMYYENFKKRNPISLPMALKFENYYWVINIIIAIFWGIIYIEYFSRESMSVKLYVTTICAALTAAGAFIYAASLKISFSYQCINLLPVTYVFIQSPEVEIKVLAGLSLVYLAIMLNESMFFNKTIVKSITLNIDKTEILKDLRNANKELVEKQKEVVHSSRLAAIGVMSAGVAHEISNPLTVISGATKIVVNQLEKEHIDRKKVKTYVEKISKMTFRMHRIVQSLRTISSEKQVDIREISSLKEILDQTLDLCGEKLRNKDIELIIDLPDEFKVNVNSVQISQVILNLINNAVDAMEEHGGTWIRISGKKNKQIVKIKIENNGEKIKAKVIEKLFTPFFSTKEVGKGTGIGLSISKGIMTDHKGDLYLDENCENTCFVVLLPLGDTN